MNRSREHILLRRHYPRERLSIAHRGLKSDYAPLQFRYPRLQKPGTDARTKLYKHYATSTVRTVIDSSGENRGFVCSRGTPGQARWQRNKWRFCENWLLTGNSQSVAGWLLFRLNALTHSPGIPRTRSAGSPQRLVAPVCLRTQQRPLPAIQQEAGQSLGAGGLRQVAVLYGLQQHGSNGLASP